MTDAVTKPILARIQARFELSRRGSRRIDRATRRDIRVLLVTYAGLYALTLILVALVATRYA